jgi:hypothetical protein
MADLIQYIEHEEQQGTLLAHIDISYPSSAVPAAAETGTEVSGIGGSGQPGSTV